MATEEQIARLRRMTGETDSTAYTNTELEQMINEHAGDLNIAASRVWGEKASDYADLVNMSEAGSSRSNSDLFAHAKAQQDYFQSISVEADVPTATYTQTRQAVRK